MSPIPDVADPEAPVLEGPVYPTVESFIEEASSEQVPEVFASIRSALTELKGPRAAHGKKVGLALDHAEALLSHLLEVRDDLAQQPKGR